MSGVTVRPVTSTDDLAAVRLLFEEYAASLNFSLCFQDFDRELVELPGVYGLPHGRLLLAASVVSLLGAWRSALSGMTSAK